MRRLVIASMAFAVSMAPGTAVEAEEGLTAAGAFSPGGSLAADRMMHTATLLPDGRVLVIGGWGRSASPASEEV